MILFRPEKENITYISQINLHPENFSKVSPKWSLLYMKISF
jgi:hypothetical protein